MIDARNFIDKYSFFPLHKTHLKTDKQFKTFDNGIVSYQESGDTLVIAGDPICPKKTDIPKVLDEFCDWAKTQGQIVCGYYFSGYVAEKSNSLKSYMAGVSLGCKLSDLSTQGKGAKEYRRALNYGEKRELQFKELSRAEYFENFFAIKNLENKWFKKKSKFKRIKFLLSPVKIEESKVSDRHFVILNKKNKIIAYVSLDQFKEPGKKLSFYVDHMFSSPAQYKQALDYLLVKILFTLQGEGHKYLDFGFCPFKNVEPKNFVEASLYLTKYIKYIYNSKGVYNFKKKFCNHQKPVYLLMTPDKSKLIQMYSLFKVTFS